VISQIPLFTCITLCYILIRHLSTDSKCCRRDNYLQNMIFESIAGKIHFRFKDRINAAGILGESLKGAIVLGIPRGGVVTADVVAKKLSCKLDIVIPRKLTDPDNKEHALTKSSSNYF